jgi:hypothetical protein
MEILGTENNINHNDLTKILSNDIIYINMPTFDDLSTSQLKQVISNYNMHFIIKQYSTKKRAELLEICNNMFNIDNQGIRLKKMEPIVFEVPPKKATPRRKVKTPMEDISKSNQAKLHENKKQIKTLENFERKIADFENIIIPNLKINNNITPTFKEYIDYIIDLILKADTKGNEKFDDEDIDIRINKMKQQIREISTDKTLKKLYAKYPELK